MSSIEPAKSTSPLDRSYHDGRLLFEDKHYMALVGRKAKEARPSKDGSGPVCVMVVESKTPGLYCCGHGSANTICKFLQQGGRRCSALFILLPAEAQEEHVWHVCSDNVHAWELWVPIFQRNVMYVIIANVAQSALQNQVRATRMLDNTTKVKPSTIYMRTLNPKP